MLSATTIGTPSLRASSTSLRFSFRLLASVTQTSSSGMPTSARMPDHDVACDRLVGAQRVEAVGAGQIQHAELSARGGAHQAFLALHGHAGIVGHLLAAAGQQVEQGGLAAVGVAEQGDMQVQREGVHRSMRPRSGRNPPRTGAARRWCGPAGRRSGRCRAGRGRSPAPARPAGSRFRSTAAPARGPGRAWGARTAATVPARAGAKTGQGNCRHLTPQMVAFAT